MPLSREAQIKALKALKYNDEQITEMLDATDEVDITLPPLRVYDDAGYTELEANIRKGYVKDKDAQEIWCRNMNTEYELGLTGAAAKDPKKIVEAMKAKAVKEAGVTPAEWETKFADLQKTVDSKNTEIQTAQQQLEALKAEKKYRKLFFDGMTDALDEDEWIARLQRTFEIKMDGDVEGLFDRSTGKFVADEKANTLPYQQAWEQERGKDKYKSWHKVKAAPATDPKDPKVTHDPRVRNPALPKVSKYKSTEDIIKEVDKQFPIEKKGKTEGWARKRQELFNRLRAETIA